MAPFYLSVPSLAYGWARALVVNRGARAPVVVGVVFNAIRTATNARAVLDRRRRLALSLERIGIAMLPSTTAPSRATASGVIPRILGVVSCSAVVAIQIIDQGGLPGSKDPEYTQVLYCILELAGVAVAALLLTRYTRLGWVLSLGVAVGPILGYVLSRGPGLPDYTDDIGNWTEPIGVLGLIVEGILLTLAATIPAPTADTVILPLITGSNIAGIRGAKLA